MNINKTKPRLKHPFSPITSPTPERAVKQDQEGFWDELFSGELNEIGVYFNPEYIDTTIEGAHSLGEGLRKTWTDLKDKVNDVFEIDGDKSTFSDEFRKKATDVTVQVAKGLGYTAAGVQGLGGLYKLAKGIKEKDTGQKISGIFDLSTSAAVATTIAGMAIGPLVLGPVAATMGIVRGGFNAVKGFLEGNGRKEIQGGLDATRSASVGFKLAGSQAAWLGATGTVLGAAAGVIQASRGFYDLSAGLENKAKDKQWKGLTDIASAAGLTLALTGVGTIPGIAITALAMGSRFLYQFSDKYEARANRRLDQWEPALQKAVNVVNTVADPIIKTVRSGIEKFFGRHRGEEAELKPPPESPGAKDGSTF